MVQVGVWMVSDAVKLRVMSSPLLALPVPASAIDTEVNVGWVLSIVTLEPSVTAVTATPVRYVREGDQRDHRSVGICVVGLDDACPGVAAWVGHCGVVVHRISSTILHSACVGVWISSDETIVSVISPSLAFPVPAVAIPTDVSVGTVVSRT